ncbi:MAG: FkbM family methyltransferase [Gallionella sp.]|nr:FkbM family methyltransferase [Gallionella sp.]MDD4945624.1 FkbM family methyltransferase [Gallionella sp.]
MSKLTVQILQPLARLAVSLSPTFPRLWAYVVKARQHYARANPPLEIETVYEGDIRVRALLSDHIEAQLFWQGFQEADEGVLKRIKRHLPEDGTFIDIGANIGSFTLVAAHIAPHGQVHSFEPSDHHFCRLSHNVALNSFNNVTLNKLGLNDQPGSATLFLPSVCGEMNNSGAASLYAAASAPGAQVTEEVALVTLDDYVQEKNIQQIDLIKIDIEGAEFNALKGAAATLARFRPIVLMEMDKDSMQRAACKPEDILDFWRGLGYTVGRIANSGEITPINSTADLLYHQNLMCSPT